LLRQGRLGGNGLRATPIPIRTYSKCMTGKLDSRTMFTSSNTATGGSFTEPAVGNKFYRVFLIEWA